VDSDFQCPKKSLLLIWPEFNILFSTLLKANKSDYNLTKSWQSLKFIYI